MTSPYQSEGVCFQNNTRTTDTLRAAAEEEFLNPVAPRCAACALLIYFAYTSMPDNSFDVVSQIEMPEVNNAIQQAMKEVTTRYDLKDTKSLIDLNEKEKKV